MEDKKINLEPFTENDFDLLIGWVKNEKEMVQFAGPVFTFPLTKVQLYNYIHDKNRYAFKVVDAHTKTVIGHCECYKQQDDYYRLCRILVGNKSYRGKGYGTIIITTLTQWIFDKLHARFIDLNVFDFNTAAIKLYEKVGFKIVKINEHTTRVDNELWSSYNMVLERQVFFDRIKNFQH